MLRIYNSLSNKKEIFKPLKDNFVKMYVCGPTVYDRSHLGHGVSYVRFDFIRRSLEFLGYRVKFIMNITDVHDDIVKRAKKIRIYPLKLARKYEKEFKEDMKLVKFKFPNRFTRVTEYIPEIIDLIKNLIKNSYAYETEDGVYFDISKFKDYGKLSGIKLEKLVTGTRIRTDKYEKEEIVDFALWKKENDKFVFDSPWGKGRPGWHIECSVMSVKNLGMPIDIHGGGLDLKFPHHENEIAQSEAGYGKKPFVRFWLHSGLLYINGQKMSKSLGNFIFLRDYLKESSPRFFRFFVLSHHYRSQIDFNEKNVEEAKNSFFSLNEKIALLTQIKLNNYSKESIDLKTYRKKILSAIEDDFNSPLLLSYIFELLKESENLILKNSLSEKSRKEIIKFLKEIDKIFVFLFPWKKLTLEVKNMVLKRDKLRKEKKFFLADKIRDKLKEKNIHLNDLKEKTIIIDLN